MDGEMLKTEYDNESEEQLERSTRGNRENEEDEEEDEEDDEDEEDADEDYDHDNKTKIEGEKGDGNKTEKRNVRDRWKNYKSIRKQHYDMDVQNSNFKNVQDFDLSKHKIKRELTNMDHYSAAAAVVGVLHHSIHNSELLKNNPGIDVEQMKMSRDTKNACLNLGLSLEICVVCGDRASGRHYGAISCEGCKGFFKRSIRKQLGYQCRGTKGCEVTKHHRNRCQYCRLQKCLAMGMRSDSVQHERKPVIGSNDVGQQNTGKSANRISRIKTEPPSIPSMIETNAIPTSWEQPSFQRESTILEEQYSSDSELSEALTMAREQLISHALDSMAKIVASESINGTDGEPEDDWNCGQLLFEENMQFELRAPSPAPAYLSIHYICESAARLLFLSVHWARGVSAFQVLPPDVQTCLVRNSWGQLFTLGLAQCAYTLSLPSILTWIINHLQASIAQEKMSVQKIKSFTEHIRRLQDCITSLHRLQVSTAEYAYLKALALFSSDHISSGIWRKRIQDLQDTASKELQQRVGMERLPRLLLRLAPLRSISSKVLEDLFFAGLIGKVSVASVVPYILTMQDSCKLDPENQMRAG